MENQQGEIPNEQFPAYGQPQSFTGREHMTNPCLCVSLPRGKAVMLTFDRKTRSFVGNQEGLFRTFFQRGVMDFEGHRRWPSDGDEFLTALYDWLFLHGYRVTWKWGSLLGDKRPSDPFKN
jgi:hypothetical protein